MTIHAVEFTGLVNSEMIPEFVPLWGLATEMSAILLFAAAAAWSSPTRCELNPQRSEALRHPEPWATIASSRGPLSRRAVLTAAAAAAAAGVGGLPLAVTADEPPLTGSQMLTASEYLTSLREARRGLEALRPLLARNDDAGYEAVRVELRKPPVNGIRKAASKLVALLPEGDYRKKRDAQYDAIKKTLGSIDDGCRPEAKRDDLPGQLTMLEDDLDTFTAGYEQ